MSGAIGVALALTSRGRFKESIEQLKLAQQIDPATSLTSNILAVTLFCAHRYDEAIAEAQRHLRMDPDYVLARFTLTNTNSEAEKGNMLAALQEYRRILERERFVEVFGRYGNAQARAGSLAEARETLGELERIEQTNRLAGVALARVCTGLGDKPHAWLGKAADAHLTDVAFIGVDPGFDPLRREPAFLALCERLHLPAHP